ncbi:LuxR C-terminal-related transcriptional regulator [Dyella mobilis]|uniref:HTH luxR-type domain-containing protein n=1 Tax=Dyella mobilis TaxID=1849582 RepID=A0ABS2KCK8_9GAMM|nr:hypothetical protein [Dyella mobilis]
MCIKCVCTAYPYTSMRTLEFPFLPTCLLTGHLNKQIAMDLGAAEKTIKIHRSRIMHKLGIRSPVELLRFLERADLH